MPVPGFVQEAISRPVIHHRRPAFRELYADILEGLEYLFQTQSSTGLMIGSGTFGVETAMYSLFRPEETVLIVSNGKFSRRWVEYAHVLNLTPVVLEKPWGEVPGTAELVDLANREHVAGVVITHCETSTSALTDLEPMSLALREALPEVCILVDAITSAGAMPFYLDHWSIDAAVVASQKALMNPAGIIAWAMSERAIARLQPTHAGDFANWHNYHQAAQHLSFPFTPPIQGMYGIQAALSYFQEQGLPKIWNDVHRASRLFKQEVEKLGAKVIGGSPSDSLTAFEWPGKDMRQIDQHLLDHGFELAGGQGDWKHQILRISHMGTSADETLVKKVLEALGEIG